MNVPERKIRDRWPQRYSLLFSLLALLILVEVLTVFAVLASQRYATERALREYTHELLKNVVDETRENAAGYLRQAQDSVSLASRILEAGLLAVEQHVELERYLLEQLAVVPQLDAFYYGNTDGDFVFSKRGGDSTAHPFFSKIIRTAQPAEQRVMLIDRGAGLVEQDRRFDPNDNYDPRTRPWFALAAKGGDAVWTDPYIFYTSKRPGLTVARPVHGADGALLGVVGADIELSALSRFLKSQRIGSSGAAFIIYSNGDVLAHPGDAQLARQDERGGLRLKTVSELDEITARAGARLLERFPDLTQLDDIHYDTFESGDRRYLMMFVPLIAHGEQQWVMGVYAPEDELAVKIREGQRESIFLGVAMSLLVVTAAILIGLIMLRPINALQRQASEDPLTGLLNRRSFDAAAGRALTNSQREQRPLSAIMIDIDDFKQVNDQHGHAVGDEVLTIVARRLGRGLCDADLLARYGGEEFAVILPDTPIVQASLIAERLRELVNAEPVKTTVGPLAIAVSLGVSCAGEGTESLAGLLDRADHGLLTAKREGRDRVVVEQR